MFYELLVGGKHVPRSEFWRLPPGELWWLLDAVTPPEVKERNASFARLLDRLNAAEAEEEAASQD